MKAVYVKALILLGVIALIVALVFGVLWQNNRTIDNAADRSIALASEVMAKQRAQDELEYQQELMRIENRINAASADARSRVRELDIRQRRDTTE